MMYAISQNHWLSRELVLKTMTAPPGSTIRILCYDEPLAWRIDDDKRLVIELPEVL